MAKGHDGPSNVSAEHIERQKYNGKTKSEWEALGWTQQSVTQSGGKDTGMELAKLWLQPGADDTDDKSMKGGEWMSYMLGRNQEVEGYYDGQRANTQTSSIGSSGTEALDQFFSNFQASGSTDWYKTAHEQPSRAAEQHTGYQPKHVAGTRLDGARNMWSGAAALHGLFGTGGSRSGALDAIFGPTGPSKAPDNLRGGPSSPSGDSGEGLADFGMMAAGLAFGGLPGLLGSVKAMDFEGLPATNNPGYSAPHESATLGGPGGFGPSDNSGYGGALGAAVSGPAQGAMGNEGPGMGVGGFGGNDGVNGET